jgi:hypothetical protein
MSFFEMPAWQPPLTAPDHQDLDDGWSELGHELVRLAKHPILPVRLIRISQAPQMGSARRRAGLAVSLHPDRQF